ncbi:hypothetical protein ABMA27_002635 [Loxostege sticticalis]|uniref:Uncharacterized protein n=1 Tax=Loxostege sticticalis TaxID=481309 RepID=A0ABR3HUD4_LOXSC
MPKRSAQEKLERYERKIRKLKEQKRKRHQRVLDSSDGENAEGYIMSIYNGSFLFLETENPTSYALEVDEFSLPQSITQEKPDEFSEPPISPPVPPIAAESMQEHTSEVTVPPTDGTTVQEPELDPELLSALGTSTSDTPDFGDPIHGNLAVLWPPLLKKGLPKEEKNKLLKENLIPSNCQLLQAPTLNPEIAAAVSEIVRGRDKKLLGFQQSLGQGISAVNRAMDTLLRSDDKVKALKYLSDSCRLLTDLHHSFTKDRVKLVVPSLEKSFLHIVQDTERDETLFGKALGEKIKASKAIEKQGQQIRKTGNQSKQNSAPQPSTSRPAHQGNWTGPPRYPSNRGGRGGQQRPAPRPARRPYPTTTTQTASKNFNQQKNRANAQH